MAQKIELKVNWKDVDEKIKTKVMTFGVSATVDEKKNIITVTGRNLNYGLNLYDTIRESNVDVELWSVGPENGKKKEETKKGESEDPKDDIQEVVLKIDSWEKLSETQLDNGKQGAMVIFASFRPYIESISIDDSKKVITFRGTAGVVPRCLLGLAKNGINRFTVCTVSPPPKQKPDEKKNDKADEKTNDKKIESKIVLKIDHDKESTLRKGRYRVAKVEGLSTSTIEVDKKLFTLIGTPDIVQVLNMLFEKERLRKCTTFVSVGPNKKGEPKKGESQYVGAQKIELKVNLKDVDEDIVRKLKTKVMRFGDSATIDDKNIITVTGDNLGYGLNFYYSIRESKVDVELMSVGPTVPGKKTEQTTQDLKDDIQDVVLRIDSWENLSDMESLDREKQSAMVTISRFMQHLESVSIEDSNKMMTLRGKAGAMPSCLLGLDENGTRRFTVCTVSPPPKKKPDEKREAATSTKEDEKKNDKKIESKKLEFKFMANSSDLGKILTKAMTIVAGVSGLHSISILKEANKLQIIGKNEATVHTITVLDKNMSNYIDKEAFTLTTFTHKPPNTKVPGKDVKKEILLKLNHDKESTLIEARKRVATVVGLSTNKIDVDKKLLTLIGTPDIVQVLNMLFKNNRLRERTTFVSVGPDKKEEEKKKGGGEMKNNPSHVTVPAPAPIMHHYPNPNDPYSYSRITGQYQHPNPNDPYSYCPITGQYLYHQYPNTNDPYCFCPTTGQCHQYYPNPNENPEFSCYIL